MAESAIDWDAEADIRDQTVSYFVRGMRTFWKLVASERTRIFQAAGVLVFVELLSLLIPLCFALLLDTLTSVSTTGISWYILTIVALMFFLGVGSLGIKRYIQEPLFLRAVIKLENHWPTLAHEKLLALPLSYHERNNTGRNIAKVNKGVERMINMLVDVFWNLLPSLAYLVLNIPIMIYLDWRLALLFLAPLGPFVWLNLTCYQKFYPRWESWEKKKEESVGVFCRTIINVRTGQSFVCEHRHVKEHGDLRKEMHDLDLETGLSLQHYYFVMELLLKVSFIITIVTGLFLIQAGLSTVGTVTYIFITGNMALQSLWSMVHVYTRVLRHLMSVERMHKLLEEPVMVANVAPGVVPDLKDESVCMKKVSHTYPGKCVPVLKDIDLSIKQGSMVAFVGASGAGKSTLVDLITRVQDPSDGVICVGPHDIRSVDRDWYRGRYAVVHQDVEIYEGTIKYNVTLGHIDASPETIAEALEAACLSEMLADNGRFPDGVLTEVGDRGIRLSGGEQQRVGIARAYLALKAGARVLVLDEATSSLDSESERVVQSFIERLRKRDDVTILAIAHRLSTIYAADRICVLQGGEIIEDGSHTRLLQKNGLYKRLVALQNLGALSA